MARPSQRSGPGMHGSTRCSEQPHGHPLAFDHMRRSTTAPRASRMGRAVEWCTTGHAPPPSARGRSSALSKTNRSGSKPVLQPDVHALSWTTHAAGCKGRKASLRDTRMWANITLLFAARNRTESPAFRRRIVAQHRQTGEIIGSVHARRGVLSNRSVGRAGGLKRYSAAKVPAKR